MLLLLLMLLLLVPFFILCVKFGNKKSKEAAKSKENASTTRKTPETVSKENADGGGKMTSRSSNRQSLASAHPVGKTDEEKWKETFGKGGKGNVKEEFDRLDRGYRAHKSCPGPEHCDQCRRHNVKIKYLYDSHTKYWSDVPGQEFEAETMKKIEKRLQEMGEDYDWLTGRWDKKEAIQQRMKKMESKAPAAGEDLKLEETQRLEKKTTAASKRTKSLKKKMSTTAAPSSANPESTWKMDSIRTEERNEPYEILEPIEKKDVVTEETQGSIEHCLY